MRVVMPIKESSLSTPVYVVSKALRHRRLPWLGHHCRTQLRFSPRPMRFVPQRLLQDYDG